MKSSLLLKIAAILWIVWGLVHMFAGIMTMNFVLIGEIDSAVGGIADAVDPELLSMEYHAAVGAVLGQHGFNLLWIGLITFICSFFIWKGNKSAVLLAAITGGLADLGYFLFLDLGGFVHFVPGTVMTLFSSVAIIFSTYAVFKKPK